ncbi:MAG: squalene synthase HpnC [Rickettsiales bacterium]
MSTATTYAPGEKTHRDENFPVASFLIAKPFRAAVMAFYRFARATDDIADNPQLAPEEKIRQLDQFEATLLGQSDAETEAMPLREACTKYAITPRHGQDLLIAFRQDATKLRYENWDELVHYCMFSAAPVGRFVLEVHGELSDTWKASDDICSALQIINHLQDCRADYQRFNRIYLPRDAMEKHGVSEAMLVAEKATPQLRACLAELTARTKTMMDGAKLSGTIRDLRLAIEIETIERLAHALLALLAARDPLSERVHLSKGNMLAITLRAALAVVVRRIVSVDK